MKAKRALTIALATLCGAAIIPVGSAFGAEEVKETDYPQNFDCTLGVDAPKFDTPIRDFAVYGDNFAVAHSNYVYVLFPDAESGERQMQKYEHTSGISAIDYNVDGKLYFNDATDVSYKLSFSSSEKPETEVADYEFKDASGVQPLTVSDTAYYTLTIDNELTYCENKIPTTIGTGYTLLKQCGDVVYTVKENLPYSLEGSTAKLRDDYLKYTNFDGAKRLYTGTTKQQLAGLNETIQTDEIREGAFYTKLVGGELGETFDTDVTTRAKINTTCLVLCQSGNASIVAIKDDYYITATANLIKPSQMQPYSDGKSYFTIADVNVYSTPFMSESTILTADGKKQTLKAGQAVNVIERYEHSVLSTTFCKINFENEDGNTVTGYVAANFISKYSFSAEDNGDPNKPGRPVDGGDAEPSYDTNVASVILAIVIVALVIIAILYVALVSSKKDKKIKKTVKKKEPEPEEEEGVSDSDSEE